MPLQKNRVYADKPVARSAYRVGGYDAVFLFIISFSLLQFLHFTGKNALHLNRIFASNSPVLGLSNCFTKKYNTNITHISKPAIV